MNSTRFPFARFLSCALVMTLGSSSLTAMAAEPSPTELAVARRLFSEATDLEAEQQWQLAASKLKEAIQIKDTPGLRFHLALCEEKLGLLVEAQLDYTRAYDLIQAGANAPDVEALLGPARDALDQRVPILVVVAPADVQNLEAELDGRLMGRSVLGRPAPINPGEHRIAVRAPGYQEFVREVTVREGERRTIEVYLLPSPAQAPPVTAVKASEPSHPETAPAGPRPSKTRTYVLIGESAFTLAALGVGVGFLIARNASRDRVHSARDAVDDAAGGDSEAYCASGGSDISAQEKCDAMFDAISDYDRQGFISAVGFVGAAVGAAGTALTFVLWPRSPSAPEVSLELRGQSERLLVRGTF